MSIINDISKRRVAVYGNCQTAILFTLLSECKDFNEKFTIDSYVAHDLTEDQVSEFFQNVDQYDIVIYQIISDEFRGGKYSSANFDKFTGKHIRVTNVYYSGYHPEASYLYDVKDHLNFQIDGVDTPSVHDINIFYRWMWKVAGVKNDKISKFATISLPILNDKIYSRDYSLRVHYTSLARLEYREELFNCDVKVSPYIRMFYRSKRLFYTPNHPTLDLILFMIRQLAILLKFEFRDSDYVGIKDPSDYLVLPIYKSTYDNLGLQFADEIPSINYTPNTYRYNGINYSPKEIEEILHSNYSRIGSLIRDKNLHSSLTARDNFSIY